MRTLAVAIVLLANVARAQTSAPSAIPDQAELERQFQKTMTGATLVGWATNSAKPDASLPAGDRYVIQSASKVAGGDGDRWMLVWRAQVRGKEVPIPIVAPVKWAGDTPVISVTDMTIPGMGTYTARVTIYRDQYAGMWSGHNHGGYLCGRIERAAIAAPATTQPAAAP